MGISCAYNNNNKVVVSQVSSQAPSFHFFSSVVREMCSSDHSRLYPLPDEGHSEGRPQGEEINMNKWHKHKYLAWFSKIPDRELKQTQTGGRACIIMHKWKAKARV